MDLVLSREPKDHLCKHVKAHNSYWILNYFGFKLFNHVLTQNTRNAF